MNKKLLKEFQIIAEFYGTTIQLESNIGVIACYNLTKHVIVMDKDQIKRTDIYSIFFHELAHHCNIIDKKFIDYHTPKYYMNKRQVAIGYRAELYTDKKGKEIMSWFYPDKEYISHYNNSRKSKIAYYNYFGHKYE